MITAHSRVTVCLCVGDMSVLDNDRIGNAMIQFIHRLIDVRVLCVEMNF